MKPTKGVNLALTDVEAKVLLTAAHSIAEDVDQYGFSPAEKAAYVRAISKLRRRVGAGEDRRGESAV